MAVGVGLVTAWLVSGCATQPSPPPTGYVHGQVSIVHTGSGKVTFPPKVSYVGLSLSPFIDPMDQREVTVHPDAAGHYGAHVAPGLYHVGTWCTDSQYSVLVRANSSREINITCRVP
jgi:hypothetical protein